MKVTIDDQTLIELTIIPLAQIIPHEDTNPSLLTEVVKGLNAVGLQKDPILVDSSSSVILDGMHRRAALEKLGAKFALCAVYDYEDGRIELHRWLRCVRDANPNIMKILSGLFELGESTSADSIRQVENGKSSFAVVGRVKGRFSKDDLELTEIYNRIAIFDKLSKEERVDVVFIRDSELTNSLKKNFSVLLPKPLAKDDVVAIAKSGKILPYKTTRHVVPSRPLDIPYPLAALRNSDLRANLALLERIIAKCSPRTVGPGLFHNNRAFEEKTVLFS